MDDRRMQLARDELFGHLDRDTCSITIDYARYTEAELVLIALQNKIERRDPDGSIIYREYCTHRGVCNNTRNPEYTREQLYRKCYIWICSAGARYSAQPCVESSSFTLWCGGNSIGYDRFPITLDELLPTSGLKIDIRDDQFLDVLNACRLMYLADIQSEIDAI